MKKSAAKIKRPNRYLRSLLVSGLTLSNLLPLAAPIMAAGTAGGTTISNTATATFDDPNNAGQTVTVQSNTVSITVAEVAGITVAISGFDDTNGSSITTDDILFYDFRITNTGNDSTRVYLPRPNVVGADLITNGTLVNTVATDNYTIINKNGTALTTPVLIPTTANSGSLSSALTGLADGGILQADEYYTVRVAVRVTANTLGAPVTVTLGDGTGASEGATVNTEVRTVDNTVAATGEAIVANPPINGEQEGTATRTDTVGTQNQSRAFATLLKTNATPIANSVTTSADDVVQYNLQLRVENSAPAGTTGLTAAALQPVQSVKFSASRNTLAANASDSNVILISDVIPTNARLAVSGDAGYVAPVAPTDSSGGTWQVWYAYRASVNASNLDANSPLEDVWTTQAPANATEAAELKRIGFAKTSSVAQGVTTTAGSFRVVTNGLTTGGGDIYNIAQVVGQTSLTAGDNLVYDESGDQNPNNYEGSTPGPDSNYTPAQFNTDGNLETGTVTDLGGTATANIDPANNTGSGVSGEVNRVTIGAPAPITGLVNGPDGAAGASGPSNTHDDFTNKSINGVTGNQSESTTLSTAPGAVTFTNTVATNATINNVVLRPITAAQASDVDANAADNANFSLSQALPDGTTVTITTPANGSATYNYTAANGFVLASGSSSIVIPSFVANSSITYTVAVTLPAGVSTLQAYSVPIVAYVEGDLPTDTANYGVLNLTGNTDQAPNVTINRVYTGFMRVEKEVRVVDATGADISDSARPGISTFTKTPPATSQILPGERLEYRITYTNISAAATGSSSGSVVLNATTFRVIEDGITSPNNWGGVTTHVPNRAVGRTGSTVTYYNAAINLAAPGAGVTEAAANTGYVNTVGTVAPATNGTFTFQRALR